MISLFFLQSTIINLKYLFKVTNDTHKDELGDFKD